MLLFYRALCPIKNRSQWFPIGSLLELDREEGKALESSGYVRLLGARVIDEPEAHTDVTAADNTEMAEAPKPAQKAGRPPKRK
jgi:hypothetical protein